MGHAYLLRGLDLEYINLFVKEFVKYINCLSSQVLHNGGGKNESNFLKSKTWEDKCQNCVMIDKGIFPDLKVVSSQNSKSSVKNEQDMMSIEIEQIREVQNFLSLKAYLNGFKAVIIENAERMTIEAQNCFLKNLEEPRGKTIIFLISSRPGTLLNTIFSRCQEIRFIDSNVSFEKEELGSEIKDLLKIINLDLAEKFKYAKSVNLEENNFNKILNGLQRYFRSLLLNEIGVYKNNQLDEKRYSVKKLKKIIELIDHINHKLNTSNINNKLALEILLLEL